jgi:hypothetical protein
MKQEVAMRQDIGYAVDKGTTDTSERANHQLAKTCAACLLLSYTGSGRLPYPGSVLLPAREVVGRGRDRHRA